MTPLLVIMLCLTSNYRRIQKSSLWPLKKGDICAGTRASNLKDGTLSLPSIILRASGNHYDIKFLILSYILLEQKYYQINIELEIKLCTYKKINSEKVIRYLVSFLG